MQVEFTENLEFAVMLFIKEMIPPFLTDVFIITVTLHRRKPWSCALKASKRAYGLTILRPLSTVVEWNESSCKQLSHSYSTLWGKENEMP